MKIKVKRLNEKAIIPTRGSEYAAGYDLYACIDEPVGIMPHETVKLPTGISMEIPHGYFGACFPRSGTATKNKIRLANCTGVIDEDYRGEWFLPIHNDGEEVQVINPNDRLSQVVFLPYMKADFVEVNELEETQRGTGGFGSTGQ